MDCGIQVARNGLKTLVPLGEHLVPRQALMVDVLSIDTDSRSLPPSKRINESAMLLRR